MADIPLVFAAGQSADVGELADLLLNGVAEQPIWGSFLARLTARLDLAGAAFLIFGRPHHLAETSLIVPQGQSAGPFSALLSHDNLDEVAAGCAQIIACPDRDYIVVKLRFDANRTIWLAGAIAPAGQGPADDWQAVLNDLLPLLQRVVRFYLVIGESERRRRIAEHVLETSGVGVILVDSSGAVLTINAAAQTIMANTRVLTMPDGCLRAARQADQQMLRSHIRQKAQEQRAHAADPACYAAFALVRDDHPLPVTVMVRPGPSYGPVSAPLRRTATVILRDPARRLQLAGADLEQLFDLSPAEARLARLLADGLSTEEAALQLGVSRNTVRSQLQSVFAKTGTNRQGDLVRLLLSSTAALAQNGNDDETAA